MTHPPTRALIDARTYAPTITTAAAVALIDEVAAATPRRRIRDVTARQLAGAPATAGRGRLAVIVTAGAVADVAALGTAGWLFGLSTLGREIGAALVLVAALGLARLIAVGSGRVHCPGCPR